MLVSYQKPGVYYERVDAQAPAISPLRTDIAGFVGLAERGPVDAPVPVESYRQFEAHFGGFTGRRLSRLCRARLLREWRTPRMDRSGRIEGPARRMRRSFRDPRLDRAGRVAHRRFQPGRWGNNLTIRITETNQAQCMVAPHKFDSVSAAVASTAGLSRATAIRIWQDGAVVATRVISLTDAPAAGSTGCIPIPNGDCRTTRHSSESTRTCRY